MNIRAKEEWTHRGKGASYTIKPGMGVISHMPDEVCRAAIAAGKAVEVKATDASKK